MAKREKIAILPKLFDFGGDISKKWYVYFSVRDPRSGKMVVFKKYNGLFKPKTTSERYKIAQTIILRYSDLLKNGYNPLIDDSEAIYTDNLQYFHAAKVYKDQKSNNRSFNYYANEFIHVSMSGLEPATISTYKSKIRTFNNWLILKRYDELDISAISNKVIIDFFVYLNNDRKSSSVTYRKYRNLLTEFFNYLIEKDIIQINPVVRLPICRRVVDKSPKPIRSEDVEIILQELKRRKMHQLYLFIAFEYYCFMRPGEIRLMKISWIDWGNGIVRIPKDMNKTKTNKMPIIPDEFMHDLRDEQKLHLKPRDYFVIGKNKEPGLQSTGKNTMRNRFNKIRDFLEMPSDYMLYSWKHTGNIALEESGANGYERMMQNGHTSLVTTEKYTRGKMGFKSETIRHKFPALG